MAVDLAGRPICITGASSGIGAATAIACGDAGMPVVLAARRADRLEDLARRIRERGGRAEACAMNVTRPEDAERMIAACDAAFGPPYAVFANAGYTIEKPVHETTDAELRAIFETNFWGTMHALRAALPAMLAAGSGHLLVCSSSIGKFAVPFYGPYCATKAAQWHVGRAMDHELRERGIRVTTVHPIGTRTELFDVARERSGPGSTLAARPTTGPRGRAQRPERVARAVVASLRRPRTEAWTSQSVRLLAALFTASPAIADVVLWRVVTKRRLRGAAPHNAGA